ncbi:MAG: DNA mismatch repair endonuclease MutL [Bacilli bacterium]
MNNIKIMDENLCNKIAAGEVVEKIANVVKELVENSIDAKSKKIEIKLLSSGTKSIKVIDDGVGMSKEDSLLSFSAHATSKIRNENDLYFINTLGFRGEALPSIASVSDIDMQTSNGIESTHVLLKAGKIVKSEKGSCNKGTIIEVINIFYNTPVRLKFLRSLSSELANIVLFLEKLALSHQEISFILTNDSNCVFSTTGSNNIAKTIFEVFGYNVSKNIHYIEAFNDDYSIKGYITNINIQKSNKSGIVTIVNNRVVNNNILNKTIKNAYHTYMFDNKFPIVVLYIETDPTLIDVNIHPTKQDIKFSKMSSLNDLVFDEIRNKLLSINNTFKAYEDVIYDKQENSNTYNISNESKVYDNMELDFSCNEEECSYNNEPSLIEPVGLALGTYLIAHSKDIMYIIDIHAANERINYEIYLNELKKDKTSSISILIPYIIELSTSDFITISENISVLTSLGFELNPFGKNTYRITSHPLWLKSGYEEDSIKTIIDLVCSLSSSFDRVAFNDKVAASLACKASIKANSTLSLDEEEILIKRLFKCEFPYTCPHGRPTIIKYPIYELEKLFKRAQ